MEIIEVEKPVPGNNEVLVKFHAAAVTAVDISYRKPLGTISESKPRQRRLGYYLAGEVEDAGRNVTKFKKVILSMVATCGVRAPILSINA